MEELRATLKAEIDRHYVELAKLEKAYKALSPQDQQVSSGKYFGMPIWRVTFAMLQAKPHHSASLEELVEEMERDHVDAQGHPRRTVMNAVRHRNTKHLFVVSGVGRDKIIKLADGAKIEGALKPGRASRSK
jgi:heterodisulfide reductase subunit B